MPQYLRHAKYFCALLTVIAFAVQFNGISQAMSIHPDLGRFFNSTLITQALYLVVTLVVGYCFYRHPIVPQWNALALGISTTAEIAMGFSLLLTGRKMSAYTTMRREKTAN
ncbi:hypothetical protein QVA66_07345 [Staphylococcus chromogenes]|nr:hypothetical protein [Staphylococcus chromogenes]